MLTQRSHSLPAPSSIAAILVCFFLAAPALVSSQQPYRVLDR